MAWKTYEGVKKTMGGKGWENPPCRHIDGMENVQRGDDKNGRDGMGEAVPPY